MCAEFSNQRQKAPNPMRQINKLGHSISSKPGLSNKRLDCGSLRSHNLTLLLLAAVKNRQNLAENPILGSHSLLLLTL